MRLRKPIFILSSILVLALGAAVERVEASDQDRTPKLDLDDPAIDVAEPRVMSKKARNGRRIFESKCVGCHGKSGSGTRRGPPLLMYDRSNHGDDDYRNAVRNGVPQHHWKFGPMPPIKGVDEAGLEGLIAYMREIQAYNEDLDRDDVQ